MSNNKQLLLNFIAMAIAFLANAAINFFLSGFIVNTVSEEAYGFIQLSNTFITYFTIITIAINSMSSRYISIEYYKGRINKANEYYMSTLFANLVITLITAPIILFAILNLEKLVQISPELVLDVKILLAFLAGNLYLGLITTNLSVSYYIKNKLYIQSVINTLGYILKIILLIVLYKVFPPYVAIFGLVTFLVTGFTQMLNVYYKYKLIPKIKLKISNMKLKSVKTLISAGIWNSITRIGNVLSEGLDLLVTNLFLGPELMGILAIVKTIPNMISSALSNLVNIFMPGMTKLYAEEKREELVKYIKKSMKYVGIFLNIPIICIIVLGNVLFKLWYPTQDSILLQILSIITISQWIIIGPASIMHNVFTVINKIKVNSILICITGFLNIIVVYFLLKYTNLGIFAVTTVSCIFSILRNLIYTLPYSAKYLGIKWYSFFPEILRSMLSIVINVIICYAVKIIINPTTWTSLIITGFIVCIITFIVNIVVVFEKKDLLYLIQKITKKGENVKNG